MMRRLEIRLLAAALVVAVMLSSAGPAVGQSWAGSASLGFNVRTAKGKPLSGALVTIAYREVGFGDGPAPRRTTDQGEVNFVGLAEGAWSIKIDHPDHLSYLATVMVRRGKKPEAISEFLEATGAGRQTMRVKALKAEGRDLGTEVAAADPRRGDSLAADASTEPDNKEAPAASPAEGQTPRLEATEPAAPPSQTLPSQTPPTQSPPAQAPPMQEPSRPTDPAAGVPATEPQPEPKPQPENEESAAEMVAAEPPEPTESSIPMQAPEPAERLPAAPPTEQVAQKSVTKEADTAPEETAVPEEMSLKPAAPMADEPAPIGPTPPLPEPQPEPDAEPETRPEPAPESEHSAAPEAVDLPEEAEEPGLGTPTVAELEPEPMPQMEAVASSPIDASAESSTVRPPPAGSEDPPAESAAALVPAADKASTSPAPTPAPAPAPAPPAPATEALGSYRDRTCRNCRPGEWSVASSVTVLPRPRTDCVLAEGEARALVSAVAASSSAYLADYAGPLPVSALGLDESSKQQLGNCGLVVVVIPAGARYAGFRLQASDPGGESDCTAGRTCSIGDARWVIEPTPADGEAATLLWSVFHNDSEYQERVGTMTVYFVPAASWAGKN